MAINYNNVITKVNGINDLSYDLDTEIGKLEDLLARIKREWYGPASEAFQKQLTMLIEDTKKSRNKMSKVSDTIKETANMLNK